MEFQRARQRVRSQAAATCSSSSNVGEARAGVVQLLRAFPDAGPPLVLKLAFGKPTETSSHHPILRFETRPTRRRIRSRSESIERDFAGRLEVAAILNAKEGICLRAALWPNVSYADRRFLAVFETLVVADMNCAIHGICHQHP